MKSFPIIEVRCTSCERITTLQIHYDNEAERWELATRVYFSGNTSNGWQIGKTREEPDYCPEHIPQTNSEVN